MVVSLKSEIQVEGDGSLVRDALERYFNEGLVEVWTGPDIRKTDSPPDLRYFMTGRTTGITVGRPECWQTDDQPSSKVVLVGIETDRASPEQVTDRLAHELCHAWHFLHYDYTAKDLSEATSTEELGDICFHPWVYAKQLELGLEAGHLRSRFDPSETKLRPWLKNALAFLPLAEARARAPELTGNSVEKALRVMELVEPCVRSLAFRDTTAIIRDVGKVVPPIRRSPW